MFDKLLPEVLIIEEKNKKSVNISLSNDIERAGFNIIRASTLEKALTYFFSQPLAIMIISAELQENPLITINNVRKINKFSKTPIIFLLPNKQLNLTEIDDNVLFFYKPFLSEQIVGTLKNLLRRSKSVLQDNIIKFKNINIDLNTEKVYKDGLNIRLGPTEFKILRLFFQFPNEVFLHQEIIKYLWESEETFNL